MPEAAISRSASRLVVAEGGAILLGGPGNRDVHQPDRTAAVADRLQQARDEIAMHRAGVAARTVLEHAEAIDDDIDGMLADQARQRGRIHRQDRQFEIEGAHLLRGRQMPRDADHAEIPACADRR